MIHEHSPVTNAFVSVPSDMGQLNCAAFIAGILAGILDSTRFVSIDFCLLLSHGSMLNWTFGDFVSNLGIERTSDGSFGEPKRWNGTNCLSSQVFTRGIFNHFFSFPFFGIIEYVLSNVIC